VLVHRSVRSAALVVVALLVVGLAGCSDQEQAAWARPAAIVNGAEIPADLVIDGFQVFTEVDSEAPPAGPTQMHETDQVSGFLDALVRYELARAELAARGAEVTDADREEARQAIYADLGTDQATGATDLAAGQQRFEQAPELYRELQVDRVSVSVALSRTITDEEAGTTPVSDEEVAAEYEAREDEFTLRCGRALAINPAAGDLEAQEARAEEIVAALEEGEDLETFVEEETPEVEDGATEPPPPPVSEFPCTARPELEQQLPPEVADAIFDTEPGEAFGPALVGEVVFVVLVDEEQVVPRDEAEAQIRAELEAGNDQARFGVLEDLEAQLTLDADVWVDPRFGQWAFIDPLGSVSDDPEGAIRAGVAPPDGPEPPPAEADTTAVIPGDPSGLPVPAP
jgi:hypothetical protein